MAMKLILLRADHPMETSGVYICALKAFIDKHLGGHVRARTSTSRSYAPVSISSQLPYIRNGEEEVTTAL